MPLDSSADLTNLRQGLSRGWSSYPKAPYSFSIWIPAKDWAFPLIRKFKKIFFRSKLCLFSSFCPRLHSYAFIFIGKTVMLHHLNHGTCLRTHYRGQKGKKANHQTGIKPTTSLFQCLRSRCATTAAARICQHNKLLSLPIYYGMFEFHGTYLTINQH